MALTEAERQLILLKKQMSSKPKITNENNMVAMRLEPDFTALEDLFNQLLKEIRDFKPTINIPEIKLPTINVPEVIVPDFPEPRVVKVETEKVIEVIKDSIKVTGLEEQVKKIVEGLNSLRSERIQKELIGTYNKKQALQTAIVNEVVVNGDFGQFQETGGAIKKARIDADGHQQVDIVTMPAVTIPPVTVDTTGLATEAKQDATISAIENISVTTNGLTDTELRATPVPVTGSLTIDTTGLATEAKQDTSIASTDSVATAVGTVNTTLGTLDTSIQNLQAELTSNNQVTQIVDAAGEAVTVTGGKLDVNASIDTTGLALAANQQTDALTDAQLRATPINVDNGLIQGLTDTELRAAPVPVNGTVELGATSLAALEDISVTIPGTVDLGTISLTALETITVEATDLDIRPLVNTDVVTAELSATDNAVLDAIESDTTTIAGDTTSIDGKIPALGQALAAGSVPVVLPAAQITTLTPPAAITGFATSANQSTIIGHVDGIETVLGTIDADTSNISTKIDTLAGAVSATHMQVDVLTAPSTVVTATDLDIRNLTNTDVVTAELSAVDNAVLDTIAAKDFATQTTLAAINTKLVTGTDIGDVTINNATGAAAVNIQDGGNTITVDGTVSANATLSAETTKVIGTVNIAASQTVGLATGSNAIGKLAANSGVDIGDVDVLSIAAGTNKIGDVDIAPRTTGGWSVGNYTSGDTFTALTNTAQVIKGSAGKFGGYYIYNPNSAATYVIVYDIAAASVTVGTSTPKLVFCIPATSGANLELLAGIPFGTAMSVAATTTGGGNTAPTTALEAMVFYV